MVREKEFRTSPARTRHLIFLAHLSICTPFLIVWLSVPAVRDQIPQDSFEKLRIFVGFILVYLVGRLLLAFRYPTKLNWEYIFPPIDVAIISTLIYLGNRDPLSNISLLYFFPLAEAAGTLSVYWAASVASMVLFGAWLASHGLESKEPFNAIFRYFFMIVMASLFTTLARAAASIREQLGVARDRNRIAMEMHDGVQGHLVTIASQLELTQRLASTNPDRAAEIAGESKESARLAADELRFLVHRMRAPSLGDGFISGLRQFAHNQTSRNGIELEFEVSGEPFELDPETENAVFRVAQESLNNILRHSEASHCSITVVFDPHDLKLEVKDDGKGFVVESEAAKKGEHAGLEGMRDRVSKLGGVVSIESKPGAGAKVMVELPRPKRRRRNG